MKLGDKDIKLGKTWSFIVLWHQGATRARVVSLDEAGETERRTDRLENGQVGTPQRQNLLQG